MCGIVGCVGHLTSKEEKAFKMLLQIDTIRGPHSTGVLNVSRDPNHGWETLKQVGTPWELFEDKAWSGLWSRLSSALLGHNRWATSGEINNDNAHPFHDEHIVGVHNGTLVTQKDLHNHEQYKVDSENIIHNLAKEGARETLRKLFGAFALVWYDDNERTINMVRNEERPLYFCKVNDGRTYFWASESWMLNVALDRAGISHEDPVDIGVGNLFKFEVPVSY